MKKIVNFSIILIAALAAVNLTACEDKKDNGKYDPNAKVSIRPEVGVKATKAQMSALDIVKNTSTLAFYSPIYEENITSVGFNEHQKDLVNVRLLMYQDDIIYRGKLIEEFIVAEDVVFVSRADNGNGHILDTLAYIPNATLSVAEKEIRAAFANDDYNRVYQLFDEAYRFVPITGAEWRELKAQGKN